MRKCTQKYFEYIFNDIIQRIFNGTFKSVIDIERWYNILLTDEQIDTINSNVENIYIDDYETISFN